MISPDDRDKASEVQKDNMHLLGNLTLTPYNSELGNRSFKEKINYKDKGEDVGLSLKLFLNDSINKDSEVWNIENIKERNSVLIEKVLENFKI